MHYVSTMTITTNNMNKTLQKLFLCCLLLSVTTIAQAQFSGSGSGTPNDPYMITTPAQLDEIRNDLEAHYKLQNDIDLTDYLAPDGAGYARWGDAGWKPIGHYHNLFDMTVFTGSLNGAGYNITGLWINRPDERHVGFFGYTLDATIDSLGIELAEAGIKGGEFVGGLVGMHGWHNESISHCYVTGSVSGGFNIGTCVGGLVGYQVGILSNSYAAGSVTNFYSSGGTGGLVGCSSASNISNCYAANSVSGKGDVGGLAGSCLNSRISNCYAVGSVIGLADYYVGGLVGYRRGGNIISGSFFDTQTTRQTNGVGVGIDTGIIGITTQEMKTGAVFGAWNFSDVWGIYEGYGYPYLRSFNNDMLIVPEGGSKTYDGQSANMPIAYDVISDNPEVDCIIAKAQLTGELAYSVEAPKNAGEYAILQHTLYNPSYQISFKHDVAYAISKRPLRVEAIDETIYCNETPVLDYSIMPGDLIDGDELSGALYVDDLKIGDHKIIQGTLTAGDNYLIIFTAGVLTVLDSCRVDLEKILADKQTLTAYPNPTSGQLIINNEQAAFGASQLIINKIQVFDLNGKLVLQPTTNSFDISHLPNGTYMVKVNEEVIKIVKK